MAEALLALALAYIWVGALRAIDRFERLSDRPEYETAQPEYVAAPSVLRTVRTIFLFPLAHHATTWTLMRDLLLVFMHAAVVFAGALAMTTLLDRTVIALAAVGLLICLVAFFYILTSTTRVD